MLGAKIEGADSPRFRLPQRTRSHSKDLIEFPLERLGNSFYGGSLALIGNASGMTLLVGKSLIRGVFDKETRRKPLAFAADAVRYGI